MLVYLVNTCVSLRNLRENILRVNVSFQRKPSIDRSASYGAHAQLDYRLMPRALKTRDARQIFRGGNKNG